MNPILDIERRRDQGERPTVGPYLNYKDLNRQTVEIWELAELACARLVMPENQIFRTAMAKGIGEYLTTAIDGVQVMLTENLQPGGATVQGWCSIRMRRVEEESGEVSWSLFLKFEPSLSEPMFEIKLSNQDPDEGFGPDSNGMHVVAVPCPR